MTFPTRVLLLRHGETAQPQVFHGAESDVGLGKRGWLQVRQTAPILAAYRPVAVVSSAMRRAIQSAQPIAEACGMSLRIEPSLHERRVGVLSGKSFDAPVWQETLQRWIKGETGYAPEGAESFDDIHRRVRLTWDRLAEEYAGQIYVIVAHGVVVKVLACSLGVGLGPADWHRFRTHNMGINELVRCNGSWGAVRWADVGHLEPSG